MYQQPIRPQQTWSSAQFAQGPKPTTVSTWASAPVIPTAQTASTIAVPHPAPQQSFVPPVPPGVNPQQWQNGRWMYTAPTGGVSSAQPHGSYPPPSLVGWNIPAGWGITPQYYCPPQMQKQPDRSYWETKLTNNGLGLENMHIKQPVAHTAPGDGKDKPPHTPWAWVPRELDDDTSQASSVAQYHNHPQPQQPSPAGHGGTSAASGRQTGTTTTAVIGTTGYPVQGHGVPPLAYFSVPADQQQQQQQQQRQRQEQPIANDSGSRPTLPPPAIFSAHVRQQSNPHQTTTPTTHTQPSAVPGPQLAASLSSQPTSSVPALRGNHVLIAPTPQRPGQPESFTSVRQLRPTFSPAIVRTPNHYRHDSQSVVPSPRVAPWDEASGNSNSSGAPGSANKHLSGVMRGVVPSPRVLPWNSHARANDGDSPTPAPRNPYSRGESSRIYDPSTRGLQAVQRSYSIPEPPRIAAPVSRQNSMPVVPSNPDSHPGRPSIANLPQFAEEPGAVLSPLIGTVSSESSESSTSTVIIAQSPPPLFIPPRYGRSPSPSPLHRRSRTASRSSSPSSSSSSDSEDNSPLRRYRSPSASRSRHSTYSGRSGNSGNSGRSARSSGHHGPYPVAHTPQGRSPASSVHTHRSSSSSNPLPTPPQERRDPGFSLPPPQQPKPPRGTYRRTLRYGFWNRRGDYLTMDKYVVYAPPDRANPTELEGYPSPTEGYLDHYGNFIKYDATRKELPESLPRQGQPPLLPYDKFVTYVYL
ncbi:hypothetical protein B0F90DRAFT_1701508 [Multifurca ochricompacta]|uniref:Uncharacterized protein n=1 Tax=Multifurca ochricompacta TaxID=376703 RepID=A0AAD4M7Y5_9AGAM|nr:hypothetical protein B0F90DRAFT_1701508 [Multifurca ochricompacta]